MANFKISAPGRIVLCGEHAAMYGEQIIMTSLDRHTTLQFCELNHDSENIKIDFPDVDLSLNVPFTDVQIHFAPYNDVDAMILNHILLLNLVQSLITSRGMWCTYEQKYSLQTFFFLLYLIVYEKDLRPKPFHVRVSTELPVGGGLGSSTSFAVCVAACFLHWLRLQRGDTRNEFNEDELSEISNYAKHSELVVQNYNYDSRVYIYGKMVLSQFDNLTADYDSSSMDISTMRILLIDSGIRQNKNERGKQIAKINNCSDSLNSDFDTYKDIFTNIYTTLNELNVNIRNRNLHELQTSYATLQTHLKVNHMFLQSIGLSHSILDDIFKITQEYGIFGNSAGFGEGFVYILLSPSIPEEQITDLSTRLKQEGFGIIMTSVSCSGAYKMLLSSLIRAHKLYSAIFDS